MQHSDQLKSASKNPYRGLCATCPGWATCTYPIPDNRPVLFCEEFEGLCDGSTFEIWGCIKGYSQVRWSGEPVSLRAIRFALLPAVLGHYALQAREAAPKRTKPTR